MSRRQTTLAGLLGALAFLQSAGILLSAETPAVAPPLAGSNFAPPPSLPALRSPLKFFRDLLAMTPAERQQHLAGRPSEAQKVILDKLREYERLSVGERELRLRTTELSWYLRQLLSVATPQRAQLLTDVSVADRQLVEARLAYWDRIPVEQQQRLLKNEAALTYLSLIRSGTREVSNDQRNTPEALERLRRLGPGERDEVIEQFRQLFELNDKERSEILNRRPGPDREQLERALIQLQKIPAEKKAAYVDAVNKFAGMTLEEQARFLRNAEHWKRSSDEERAAWRALFSQNPPLPELPPLPPNFDPHSPPPLPPDTAPPRPPFQATNSPASRSNGGRG